MKLKTIVILVLLLSCSDNTDNKEKTISEILDIAWNNFVNKDYSATLDNFLEAKNIDSTNIDVLNGLGWTYLLLNDFNSSRHYFEVGILEDSTFIDLHAGLSLGYTSLELFAEAIQQIDMVLEIDSNWSFKYGSIDYTDLIFTKSFLYFLLEDYENSLLTIQLLDSNFIVDVSTVAGINLLSEKIESYNGGIVSKVISQNVY